MVFTGCADLLEGNPPAAKHDLQSPGHHRVPVGQAEPDAFPIDQQVEAANQLVLAFPSFTPYRIQSGPGLSQVAAGPALPAENHLVNGSAAILLGNGQPGYFGNFFVSSPTGKIPDIEMLLDRENLVGLQDQPGCTDDMVSFAAKGIYMQGMLVIKILFEPTWVVIRFLEPPLLDIYLVPQSIDRIEYMSLLLWVANNPELEI